VQYAGQALPVLIVGAHAQQGATAHWVTVLESQFLVGLARPAKRIPHLALSVSVLLVLEVHRAQYALLAPMVQGAI
jgi:hypothetical protein